VDVKRSTQFLLEYNKEYMFNEVGEVGADVEESTDSSSDDDMDEDDA